MITRSKQNQEHTIVVSKRADELQAVQHVVVVVVVELEIVKVLLLESHLLFGLVDDALQMLHDVVKIHICMHLLLIMTTAVTIMDWRLLLLLNGLSSLTRLRRRLLILSLILSVRLLELLCLLLLLLVVDDLLVVLLLMMVLVTSGQRDERNHDQLQEEGTFLTGHSRRRTKKRN